MCCGIHLRDFTRSTREIYPYNVFGDYASEINTTFPWGQWVKLSSWSFLSICSPPQWCECFTHWGWDKMAAMSQTTFSNTFSLMKFILFLIEFHWNMFPGVELTLCQHWFRWWLGAEQATSHYLNQCWHNLLTHICITRPQWVNRPQYQAAVHVFHVPGT